nr:hypothetical protein [Streptomyces tsukubensis NRRL18488]
MQRSVTGPRGGQVSTACRSSCSRSIRMTVAGDGCSPFFFPLVMTSWAAMSAYERAPSAACAPVLPQFGTSDAGRRGRTRNAATRVELGSGT